MPDQAATTTSGVVNAVSTISGSEMPSTPRWYQAFTAPIHGSRSTNCSAGVATSNAHHSGTHRPSVASVAASASARPSTIHRSPSSRTTALAAIGSQTSQLRMCAGAATSRTQEQPAEQQRQADDHGEGIVVEIAGLDAAHDVCERRDGPGAAIDQPPVDYSLVAAPPEASAEVAHASRHHVLVEPVEVVLVHEQPVRAREARSDAVGQVRAPQVKVPGGSDAAERQVDGGAPERVQDERRRAVE